MSYKPTSYEDPECFPELRQRYLQARNYIKKAIDELEQTEIISSMPRTSDMASQLDYLYKVIKYLNMWIGELIDNEEEAIND